MCFLSAEALKQSPTCPKLQGLNGAIVAVASASTAKQAVGAAERYWQTGLAVKFGSSGAITVIFYEEVCTHEGLLFVTTGGPSTEAH